MKKRARSAMAQPKTADLQKVLAALKKSDRKYLTLDDLSSLVGLYSDVLGAELSYFEPLILMDGTLNMKNLIAPLEAYLAKKSESKKSQPRRLAISAAELASYPTISAFVFAKMTTAGGLVDPSSKLEDRDLKILQKLVARETSLRRKEKRHGKK